MQEIANVRLGQEVCIHGDRPEGTNIEDKAQSLIAGIKYLKSTIAGIRMPEFFLSCGIFRFSGYKLPEIAPINCHVPQPHTKPAKLHAV